MRIFLLAFVLLSGCASREQISIRNAEMDAKNFGPGCERLGLKPQTAEWANCVSNYAARSR